MSRSPSAPHRAGRRVLPALLLALAVPPGLAAQEMPLFQDGFETLLDAGPCPELPAGFSLADRVNFNRNSQRGSAVVYEDAFGPFPLGPGVSGSTLDFQIPLRQVVSLAFEVPPAVAPDAFVLLQWVSFAGTSDGTAVSVSTCMGGVLRSQSLPQPPGKTCQFQGRASGGTFVFGPSPDAQCVLRPGQRYYLNVADHDESTGAPSCPVNELGACIWKVRPSAP